MFHDWRAIAFAPINFEISFDVTNDKYSIISVQQKNKKSYVNYVYAFFFVDEYIRHKNKKRHLPSIEIPFKYNAQIKKTNYLMIYDGDNVFDDDDDDW